MEWTTTGAAKATLAAKLDLLPRTKRLGCRGSSHEGSQWVTLCGRELVLENKDPYILEDYLHLTPIDSKTVVNIA